MSGFKKIASWVSPKQREEEKREKLCSFAFTNFCFIFFPFIFPYD